MFAVYLSTEQPPFLDSTARELLAEGRDWFRRFDLEHRAILNTDYGVLIFPWVGDRIMNTLLMQLMARGLAVEKHGPVLTVYDASPSVLAKHIATLVRQGKADGEQLARRVANKRQQKHHPYLTSELLSADYASSSFDTAGALAVWQRLAAASR
jgi:ATP-dependent Lhr-like helicase